LPPSPINLPACRHSLALCRGALDVFQRSVYTAAADVARAVPPPSAAFIAVPLGYFHGLRWRWRAPPVGSRSYPRFGF